MGSSMQTGNWRGLIRRVVELSGGEAPGGIRRSEHTMDSEEARNIRIFADRIVQRKRRAQQAENLTGTPGESR
jgi:hypothetical protein